MRTTPLLILISLPFYACSEDAALHSGVIHLDPRLADGRSSAAALALEQPLWEVELRTPDPGFDPGPWEVRWADVVPSPAGVGAFFVANVAEEVRFRRVELAYGGQLRAQDVDVVEIEIARTTRGLARVAWRNDAMPPDAPVAYADTVVPGSHEPDRVRIALGDHSEWRGTISELVVLPKQDGKQRFDLVAIRLGRIGFTSGPDPIEGGADGGLIARGRQSRRAWPTDLGVPLFDRVLVPRGGVLSVDTTLAAVALSIDEPVHFTIDVRRSDVHAGTGAWTEVARRSLVPAKDGGGSEWTPLRAHLSRWAGKQVELRLAAFRASEPIAEDAGVPPERPAVYFGAPIVAGEQPADRRPNIVLLTLDTTRADALGPWSRGRSVTPFLDGLAAEGLVCEDAWTACNATSPSHASILTGLAVQDHGVEDNRSVLGAENETLVERLRAAGWETAAAVSVEHLEAGKSGLAQGFDRFLLAGTDSSLDGSLTIDAVAAWLAEWSETGNRPVFLWVHLFDPHTPYGPPGGYLDTFVSRFGAIPPDPSAEPADLPETRWHLEGDFLAGVTSRAWPEYLYSAGVSYADRLAEQLEQALAEHGQAQSSAWFVVSDHGEGLGEHDVWYHHTGLYSEVMQVPMFLRAPGVAPGTVGVPTWSLDLAPTILAYAGVAAPDEMRGRNLLALARAEPAPRRVWFEHSDLHQVGFADSEHTFIATLVDYEQRGRENTIPAGTLELYRRDDTTQAHNLIDELDGADLQRMLDEWRASALERSAQHSELTPEQEAELNRLGYQ